jgi:hypothetical protein
VMHTIPLEGQSQHIYWYPPLGYVLLAGWMSVFGHTLMAARWFSVVCGVFLLGGIFLIGKNSYNKQTYKDGTLVIGKNSYAMRSYLWTGVWAVLICALDYNFLRASDARPDTLAAALGVWGIALMNPWLTVAAMMVHPFGAMYVIAQSIIRRKVPWVPLAVALGAWGLYIAQDPVLWFYTTISQFQLHFFTQMEEVPGPMVYMAFGNGWRLLLLAVYVGCAALMALKNRNQGIMLGVVVMGAFFLSRAAYYMVYALPWLSLCVAIQLRKYPWCIVTLLLLECAFAVTTFKVLWNFQGVFNLP